MNISLPDSLKSFGDAEMGPAYFAQLRERIHKPAGR